MAKQRITLSPPPQVPGLLGGSAPAFIEVIAEKSGKVNWLDRAKKYYKSLIVVVGALVDIACEISGVFHDQGWMHAVVMGLTATLAFLKRNEKWVDFGDDNSESGDHAHPTAPAPDTDESR